jgi:hypothetical protein
MRTNLPNALSGLLFVVVLSCIPMAGLAQDNPPAVDPKAIAALESMGAYLRTLKSFEITATTTTDEILDDGMKVQFDGTAKLTVRRPDRMRLLVESDRKHRELFYDGKSVTLYGPRVKYYATVAAPPTVRETVEVLAKKYGMELPLADLFVWGTDKARPDQIKRAIDLGPATVGGVSAEQYAFRQEGVDWQVWIRTGAAPVPLKLVITTTDEPTNPAHIAILRWNTTPKTSDALFTFVPPAGALKIAIQAIDEKPAAGATAK